jgi:hypothetical protein
MVAEREGTMRWRVTVTASVFCVAACADLTESTGEPQGLQAAVEPMCQLGCIDPPVDPSPGEPGYWIPYTSPAECIGYTDRDQDGFGDYCELRVAEAFSPELYYNRWDNVGYEPKWAAQPLHDLYIGSFVRLFYALSYYKDDGPVGVANDFCDTWSDLFPDCRPHWGDSEAIVLDVVYEPEEHHWKLARAHLSRHQHWDTYFTGGTVSP